MQIKNPTKEVLEVQVKGIKYRIEPEGTINNVPEEHARYWQESIHKFIILRNEKSEVVEEEAPVIDTSKVVEPKIETEEYEVLVPTTDTESVGDIVELTKEEVIVLPKKTVKKVPNKIK